MLVQSRPWSEIIESFRDLGAQWKPIADLVEQIATSEYSNGLFPMKSMHTLIVAQTQEIDTDREILKITYSPISSEFHFCYHESNVKKNWERTAKDSPFRVFERFLEMKNWFVQYDGHQS